MGTRIIPIILVVIILAAGGVAFKFYSENQILNNDKNVLTQERDRLLEENTGLKRNYDRIKAEKSDLEARWAQIQDQLSTLEKENSLLKKKYEEVAKERDVLVEKIKTKPEKVEVSEVGGEGTSEDYWVDFVKQKAELAAKLDVASKELINANNNVAALDKQNKELSIKIDELNKQKDRLNRDLTFRKRTVDIMSIDLVSERESRKDAVDDLTKLRGENINLKRELVLANKEKLQIQSQLSGVIEKKETLEKRIAEIENILKTKSFALEELQGQLNSAIKGSTATVMKESASVELPPIVVKPGASAPKGLRGEIIAVNQEEKFVVMDIGESSGVRPGFKMNIVRGDNVVGTVEIIETRKDISAADIKEINRGYTIKEGDTVLIN